MAVDEYQLEAILDSETLHILYNGRHVASIKTPHPSQEFTFLDWKRDELHKREEEQPLHEAEIDRQIDALREETPRLPQTMEELDELLGVHQYE